MHGHSFTLPRPNPTVSPQSRCVRWSGRRHRPRNDVLLAQAPAEGGRLAQQAPASTAMIPPVAVPARLADIAATPTKRGARLSRTPVTLDIARAVQIAGALNDLPGVPGPEHQRSDCVDSDPHSRQDRATGTHADVIDVSSIDRPWAQHPASASRWAPADLGFAERGRASP